MNPNQNQSIIVYGDFTLDLKKYPRIGVKTDIIIINFLMYEDELTKCAKSLEDAIKYFNGCKEYFYTYHAPGHAVKRYSAKEIIYFHNMLSNRVIRNSHEYMEFMKGFSYADQCYISYLRCRDFYMNLFKSMKSAKDAHFERRDFVYRVVPPMEIYGHMAKPIPGQIYSAYELMELYTYTHYLKNRGIIKELPVPSFVEKIVQERNAVYMNRLYAPHGIVKEENIKSEVEEKKSINKIVLKNKSLFSQTNGDFDDSLLLRSQSKDRGNTVESKHRITNTTLWESN